MSTRKAPRVDGRGAQNGAAGSGTSVAPRVARQGDAAPFRRRREAARRLPPLASGHRDPLDALASRNRPRVPVLPAYRRGVQLLVWCEHERVWHYHGAVSAEPGAGNGHRVAHCVCASSPLYERGYVLREVGPFTPAVRREHGRPLSWARGCRTDSCRFDRDGAVIRA